MIKQKVAHKDRKSHNFCKDSVSVELNPTFSIPGVHYTQRLHIRHDHRGRHESVLRRFWLRRKPIPDKFLGARGVYKAVAVRDIDRDKCVAYKGVVSSEQQEEGTQELQRVSIGYCRQWQREHFYAKVNEAVESWAPYRPHH